MSKYHIPQVVITQVKERIDLAEIVGAYVSLDRHSRGLCPFHQEKTPSFQINLKKRYWHCFGCGLGGDAITFVKHIEGVGFIDAVKILAAQTGVPLPQSERFKSFIERRFEIRKARLEELAPLENAFMAYLRGIADYLLIEWRYLPWAKPRQEWDAQDYLAEQYIEYKFDNFNQLRKRLEEKFLEMRRTA